jgi:ActR/RegA family two-component response regulator
MAAEQQRIYVLLIEDDAPLMRTMSWALTENGFDVEVVSRAEALEPGRVRASDVAIFNMSDTAGVKTIFNRELRSLNPDILIIDVDEFITGGGSIRDSAADDYTGRPANLDAITRIIKEQSGKSPQERSDRRDEREQELRPDGPNEQP